MTPLSLENWTLVSLSRGLRKKEISPVEVVRAYLARIETYDGSGISKQI